MAGRNSTTAVIDGPAIVLSSLCLIHCLALPIMSAALPVAGVWAEAEWVHRLFVLLTVPFAFLALASKYVGYLTGSLIVFGISFLAAGAFVEGLHDYEVSRTVVGASLLAAGHGLRWLKTYNPPH
jgi:ethanolamine transporter EutH